MSDAVITVATVVPVVGLVLLFSAQRAATRRGKPIPTSRIVSLAATSIASGVLIGLVTVTVINLLTGPQP